MLFPTEPIGRCIYCRSTSPPLTDEHVVPYALDGDYVLKEATCGDCQKATSKFEREVLRNGLAQARAVLGLSTRHPKKRPVYGILRIDRGQKAETLIAPLKETGAMVPLFTFPSPAFITRHPYAGGIQPTAIWAARVGGKPFGEIPELRGIRTIRGTTHYSPVPLARLVGKIGYGFAVAAFGLEALEESFVAPAIRGVSNDIGRWVGNEPSEPSPDCPPEPTAGRLPLISVMVRKRGLIAYAVVTMFAEFGGPTYTVVVGRLRTPLTATPGHH